MLSPSTGIIASNRAFVNTSALTGEALSDLAQGPILLSGSVNAGGDALRYRCQTRRKDSTYAGIIAPRGKRHRLQSDVGNWRISGLWFSDRNHRNRALQAWWTAERSIRSVAVLDRCHPHHPLDTVPVALTNCRASRSSCFGVRWKGCYGRWRNSQTHRYASCWTRPELLTLMAVRKSPRSATEGGIR